MKPQVFMCVRVAVDLKLFHLIAEHGGPITAAELATASGAEQQLLGTFKHHLNEILSTN